MRKQDLRAVIAQEVSRAQIMEAVKGLKNENISADYIIKEYTSLMRQLSEESGISLKEANRIVGNALKNGGKVELDESSNIVISEGFFSRLGGFYRDVFKAAANALDPGVAQKLPKPEDVEDQAKGAEQGGESTMDQLMKQLKDIYAKAMKLSKGNDEAEEELQQKMSSEFEDIDNETGEDDAGEDDAGGEGAKEGPVELFKGEGGGLYSKLYTTIRQGLSASEYAAAAKDKAAMQNMVKQILKDLSAQLRANGLKVQENQIPLLGALIVEKIENKLTEKGVRQADGSFLDDKTGIVGTNKGNRRARRAHLQPGYKPPEEEEPAIGASAEEEEVEVSAEEPAKKVPLRHAARVKPTKGRINVSQAIFGKVHQMIADAEGVSGDDKDLVRVIQQDTQKMLQKIIRKNVIPFLDQYVKGKGIKLKESAYQDLVLQVTNLALDEVIRRKAQ